MYDTYTFQGQVYSPAFSEPPSPMSTSSDGDESSNESGYPPKVYTPPVEAFVNKKPRFPTIYHEALQPLSPCTTLSVPQGCVVRPTHKSHVDVGLQNEFLALLRVSDLSKIEMFLREHSEDLDVNQFNEFGDTPIHEACVQGNLNLVKCLVQYGADSRLSNRDGFTLMHLASFSGRSDLLAYVLTLRNRDHSRS
ncbi:hypothetical protein TCAL_11963 [Tigriopus californicus]|uniref:Uncharacterized protein n=1 Tax=Tigriopus californicus TaxID=6832 RepID=A0A553NB54_TIGCA|nr:uncharacterized protein LOC131889205 [Tigriopus californicus]TRY62647.1 hypothetical protein TCAL_11963 [Tigriopus californicus]|eukprot:TCALIF_11963-PA protein Name:"Similar to nrarpb Notch-regulated ankyrin repeat-containing protein B (Danio rerio)" AED:0.05 eAED:0.05 QI:0/-1/0/1/-1/1/1/0/193